MNKNTVLPAANQATTAQHPCPAGLLQYRPQGGPSGGKIGEKGNEGRRMEGTKFSGLIKKPGRCPEETWRGSRRVWKGVRGTVRTAIPVGHKSRSSPMWQEFWEWKENKSITVTTHSVVIRYTDHAWKGLTDLPSFLSYTFQSSFNWSNCRGKNPIFSINIEILIFSQLRNSWSYLWNYA